MTIANKLLRMKEDLDNVYEAGKAAGGGGDDYYDTFWDAFQQNGNRSSYLTGFAGHGWTDETFRPKHDMRPTRASQMFTFSHIYDVKGALERQGVTLDTSQSTQLNSLFQESWVQIAPTISTISCTTPNNLFAHCQTLRIVELVILRDDGGQTLNNAFLNCNLLEEIRFAGKIASNVSFAQSVNLSRASMESIIAALSDTVTGQTVTFSADAVPAAFTGEEWSAIIATKPNWTIALG